MLKYTLGMLLILAMGLVFFLHSCTISFQNISTHGTATDLVDENMATSPTVSPNINVPIRAM